MFYKHVYMILTEIIIVLLCGFHNIFDDDINVEWKF